ncbi:hypothetical protein FA95DRAFT_1612116 [Auriscalpium vulgare]|uniref:Uncharacterized protein n=1 Tax=Auriscalpium vulgare TaxID=40419 RepID=A0ACB8R7R0_9AGAM|nr:hypothetical protein FA95DRAFT_1612116 [Auriscalpium vulgare]
MPFSVSASVVIQGVNIPDVGTQITVSTALSVLPLAILYYDWLLVLDREVALFWPPKNNLGLVSVFYLLNRYITVLGYIPLIRDSFTYGGASVSVQYPFLHNLTHSSCRSSHSSPSCEGLATYNQYQQAVSQILVGVLSLIRIYALYNRSRHVLGLLVVVGAVCVAIAVWVIATNKTESIKVISSILMGCREFVSDSQGRSLAAAWSGAMVFDTVIFLLTAYKGFKIGLSSGGQLLHVLVRDGTVYFTVLFLVNLWNILMLLHAPPLLKDSTTTLTNVMSSTLISRVMLNLRATPAARRTSGPSTTTYPSDVGPALTTTFDIELGMGRSRGSSSGPSSGDREPYSPGDIELVERSTFQS